MNETILKLENITKIYSNGVVANRDINIEFIPLLVRMAPVNQH